MYALLLYPILGAGIKYIDDAFDEQLFSKTFALALAPFLAVIWAYTMLIDQVSATILLAILCGVLLKGKIDNYAHLTGLAIIFIIIVLAGVHLMVLPLILLAAAALLDEVGNDIIDDQKGLINKEKVSHRFVLYFFDQRWAMKLAILFIFFMGVIPFYFFIAMMLFDAAYLLVRWYGRSRSTVSIWLDMQRLKVKELLLPHKGYTST
ncbi:MAG: hypothetical protein V1726_03615 [Methanobacteriota archaeon]